MPDLKLAPGAMWGEPVRLMAQPKSSEIIAAVDIFRHNFGRVHSFSTLFSNLLVPTIIIERARCEEAQNIRFGSLILPESVIDQKITGHINYRLNEHRSEAIRNIDAVLPRHALLIDEAYHNIQFAADNNPLTLDAVYSWFHAQLTGVWTACEILFADLWEAAVNARPKDLHGFDNDSKLGNAINISRLAQFNFDISHNLGTLLREKKNFDNFEDIMTDYEKSFRTDGAGITKVINHECFKILSNIRHIIVHNAAKFDARYLKNIPSKMTSAPRGIIGEPIPIDADVVYNILHPTAEQAVSLIHEVDKWIATH